MLNFHKGIPVQRNSGLGTLGEFYNVHNKLPQTLRTKSFALPSNMKLAGLYLYLEALILILEVRPIVNYFLPLAHHLWLQFEETTGCKVPDFILSTKDQKKRKKELEYEEGNTQKCVRSAFSSSAPGIVYITLMSI